MVDSSRSAGERHEVVHGVTSPAVVARTGCTPVVHGLYHPESTVHKGRSRILTNVTLSRMFVLRKCTYICVQSIVLYEKGEQVKKGKPRVGPTATKCLSGYTASILFK